jgi:ATP-dependent DNA ligase
MRTDGRPSTSCRTTARHQLPSSTTCSTSWCWRVEALWAKTLETRRELLERRVLPKLSEPVRYTGNLQASLADLIASVKAQGLEGLVAKRRDSGYEPGLRSGAWQKMRVNRGQEFVIGGYTEGAKTFDALVFGYYEGDRLLYAARTRNGFTPAMRAQLFKKFRGLDTKTCPFANLPEAKSGRWGQGLTKAKMADCRWLKPVLVGQFEFVEWTPDNHLRHSKFIGRARTRWRAMYEGSSDKAQEKSGGDLCDTALIEVVRSREIMDTRTRAQ